MEQWITIHNHPRYEVSTKGRVRSLYFKNRTLKDPIVKRTRLDNKGYPVVTFNYRPNRCILRVHRLVAESFLLIPDPSYIVHHLDHNRSNNSLTNLQWIPRPLNTSRGYTR